jgi:hypothetical protein
MTCNVTALVLYSIDALSEAEVVSLANHVERCGSCRKRLTDREELKAAIIEACRHESTALKADALRPALMMPADEKSRFVN